MTLPLVILTVVLHRVHLLKHYLTTGPVRSAAPARMLLKRNEQNGASLQARPVLSVVLLLVGGLDYIDNRFAPFHFNPPDQAARSALFNR
jgi:hypothetical protein